MPAKNQLIELNITGVTSEGSGVGRYEGMAVFVPFTAPGDVVRARVVKVMKRHCYAITDALLTPSPLRCDPGCPVFGKCGGCSLRHIQYDAELRLKADWVRQDLRRIGGVDPGPLDILPSPSTLRYRNKAQLPFALYDGEAVNGFYATRSHRVVPCEDCLLQPAAFAAAARAVREYAHETGLPVYDEATGTGLLRHLFLRQAEATGQLMAALVINGDSIPSPGRLVERIRAACPQTASILLNVNRRRTNVILGQECITLWGTSAITDLLCGVEVELSPLSFYQVNRRGAELLYGEAGRMAGLTGRETLLDLYCGAGTIGLSMVARAARLIGVELVPQAVENARANAARAGIDNARFLCADAGQAAARLAAEGLRPDVIVLDPPRKGCEPGTVEAVCAMAPERVVMVSCNSATAARDIALFARRGYRLAGARAVDLFPRTANVECVLRLEQAGGA